VLLSDGQGGAVILLDEANFAGKLLITTLDPEEHAGFGVVTVTLRFLEKCMAWIRQESARIDAHEEYLHSPGCRVGVSVEGS
jgi:hypothetical protein